MKEPNALDQVKPALLNSTLSDIGVYVSKAISQAARDNPDIMNMSIGEPAFGPPAHLLAEIAQTDLTQEAFLSSAKRYGHSLGSLALRQAIADWYLRRYNLKINPETEVLITHGGVEAVALAILCCSNPGDTLAITDPSYMLYERALLALGRQPRRFSRPVGDAEFTDLIDSDPSFRSQLGGAKAVIVNSPENPSGYVLSAEEWQQLMRCAERSGAWIIHDEVYDSMAFNRPHYPARSFDPLASRTVLANSFSKKFGIPGLRIGWLVGSAEFIATASKTHDYLVLGVNRQYEQIALRILQDAQTDDWLADKQKMLHSRIRLAKQRLTPTLGFSWPRSPMGGMFLFPCVRGLYQRLPPAQRQRFATVGESAADYLLQVARVATVPGIIYGQSCADHIRIVLCCDEPTFHTALERLANCHHATLAQKLELP
ncbi:pyridoxal phosphate-dependent aminotransferase [Serratia plymuthica]|uniref:pyridoxal phosphate-dependent aminotransferase n=1 Tax=Serratia plymuthica TaxID=82996 RepID=UPI0007E9D30E|nr:pyridoxal phosphate-dependent aminotransferase [Serratia plymuthica]ANJ99447.1 aspartate aminotransferase [Serratia plymuthica]